MILDPITTIISLGGIGMQIAVVFLLLSIIFKKTNNKIFLLFKNNNISLVFLIALGSVLLSLYYSEIVGFEPCLLCWWQRIFMYPLVFMLVWAIWKKDWHVVPYALILSVVGFGISVYHNYIQYFPKHVAESCGIDATISCTESYFTAFGYITIPLLALTSFAFVIILLAISYIKHE